MLYPNTLTFLQRLQMAATHGNFLYTNGETDTEGYERLSRKFAVSYETNLSRQTKSKRRRVGEATSTLYAVRRSAYSGQLGVVPVYWVLVVSEGIGRVHDRERLLDLRDPKSRLNAGGGRYELVHDGCTWSWRFSHKAYKKYEQEIHRIASMHPDRRRIVEIDGIRRDMDAERLLDRLYGEPGFRLLRRQVGCLVGAMRGEWKRLRPDNGPQLSERTFLAYVRFLPNEKDDDEITVGEGPTTAEERRALFRLAFGGD